MDTHSEAAVRIDLAAALRYASRLGLSEGICNHFSCALPGESDRFVERRPGARGLSLARQALTEVVDRAIPWIELLAGGEFGARFGVVALRGQLARFTEQSLGGGRLFLTECEGRRERHGRRDRPRDGVTSSSSHRPF